MDLQIEEHGNSTIVILNEDRLDAAHSVRFKEAMRTIAEGDASDIILDMQNVAFMDSSGLGSIVAVMKLMGRERTFRIAGLTPTVEKVFKLTRMDSVFTILASAYEAIGADHLST